MESQLILPLLEFIEHFFFIFLNQFYLTINKRIDYILDGLFNDKSIVLEIIKVWFSVFIQLK